MTFTNSINSRALEHKGTMVDVYSKMKPDTLRLQLQTVLTAYYKDIKRVVSASCCTKPKVVKCKFKDQDDTEAAAAAPPPPTPTPLTPTPPPPPPRRTGARKRHPAGRGLLQPPALGARAGAQRRRGRQGGTKKGGKA